MRENIKGAVSALLEFIEDSQHGGVHRNRDGLIVLGLRFPDHAGFSVALVPAELENISTAQSRVRGNFDHRSQIPTNLFSGRKQPLVFVGIQIPDDLIVRTEHPSLANRIGVEYALDVTPVEERLKDAEIFID